MSSIAQSFGIGIVLGIILFFVLLHLGWIDKMIASIDSRFK
jgi:hypothetical protein